MTSRLGWLPWAPHLLALAFLLVVAVNTNLGRPWRGITPSDHDPVAVAAVLFVGALPWYTALLLLLRQPALARVGAAPVLRTVVAAVATAALVAALGATRRASGLLGFNLQDLLVAYPGITAVALADGLDVRGLVGDAARVDPRRWETRAARGERRHVVWAARLPDGRVLLQVRVRWERGVFGGGAADALLALRPDGALDDRFTETFGRALEGSPLVAGDHVVLAGGGAPVVRALADGAVAAEAGRQLAAALAGASETAPGALPGTLAALRATPASEVTLVALSGAGARVLGRARLEERRPAGWSDALPDGEGLLVPLGWGVLATERTARGEAPPEPAVAFEALLRRYGPDGARDPAFRFRLPLERARALFSERVELRHLVRVGRQTLVHLYARQEHLAVVGPGGAVDPGSWLDIRTRPGEGFVAEVVPLDDGRVALVFSEVHDQTRIALVTPGRGGELPWRALAEAPPPAAVVTATAAGRELVVPGEVLAVTGAGEIVTRGPGGLRIVDAATGAERAFRPPAWLETP